MRFFIVTSVKNTYRRKTLVESEHFSLSGSHIRRGEEIRDLSAMLSPREILTGYAILSITETDSHYRPLKGGFVFRNGY